MRPKPSATPGSIRPAGSGRLRVRAMRPSRSRSMKQLRAFAAPTVPAVPRSVATHLANDSSPGASHIPPARVQSTRLESRGLVSETRSASGDTGLERARTVIRAPRSIRPAPRLQGAADREATAAPFPLRAPTGGVLTAAAADALAATRSLVASLLDVLRGAFAARFSCG